eukprot:snap_masked-scaffold_9-processed-gene-5.21-mRNA-1 protein AED:1.00 eAED:1.00 QI:0/0/0/0/1/1/2/0/88
MIAGFDLVNFQLINTSTLNVPLCQSVLFKLINSVSKLSSKQIQIILRAKLSHEYKLGNMVIPLIFFRRVCLSFKGTQKETNKDYLAEY